MNKNSHYYLDTCYQSDHLPELPDQTEDLNRSRRAKSTSARLPWGGTRDVVPVIMLYRLTPKMIRKYESNPDPAKQAGLQDQMNHERIRFEQLAWPIRLTAFLMILGKFSFFIFIALAVFTNLFISDRPNVSFIDQLMGKSQFLLLTCGIPLLLWLLGALILKLFLRPLLKPGRGPEWELNRRTGLVKIWHYPNRKIFRKRGKPTIEEVPFYEFDAYSRAVLGPYGTNSFFEFLHRYRKLSVPIGRHLLGPQTSEYPIFALWDFLQNYMDISRPLPDIPVFEKFRHLDPTTAEYDRKTNRPERYWGDMDNKLFRKKCADMIQEVARADSATNRPNIMAQKVRYASQ